MEQQNTKIVQDAYAAFGRGDIPALLNMLDDEIVWTSMIGLSPKVPTSGEWRGKSAVLEFFQKLATGHTFKTFEPKEFIAQGDTVVVIGHYVATVTHNQRTFASDWVMVFTLRNGKVVRFREFADSAAANAAFL